MQIMFGQSAKERPTTMFLLSMLGGNVQWGWIWKLLSSDHVVKNDNPSNIIPLFFFLLRG